MDNHGLTVGQIVTVKGASELLRRIHSFTPDGPVLYDPNAVSDTASPSSYAYLAVRPWHGIKIPEAPKAIPGALYKSTTQGYARGDDRGQLIQGICGLGHPFDPTVWTKVDYV